MFERVFSQSSVNLNFGVLWEPCWRLFCHALAVLKVIAGLKQTCRCGQQSMLLPIDDLSQFTCVRH